MSDKQSLPPINETKKAAAEPVERREPQEKWQPQNWNAFKRQPQELRKMAPQLRSRYLAYEETPKDVAEFQTHCKQRLVELKRRMKRVNQPTSEDEVMERDKHEKLIGQLKAAEARNRIRIMRLRYEANRGEEISHLISCQPTARRAVRLQALLPMKGEDRSQGDALEKGSRARVEALLEDSRGLLTGRS